MKSFVDFCADFEHIILNFGKNHANLNTFTLRIKTMDKHHRLV